MKYWDRVDNDKEFARLFVGRKIIKCQTTHPENTPKFFNNTECDIYWLLDTGTWVGMVLEWTGETEDYQTMEYYYFTLEEK